MRKEPYDHELNSTGGQANAPEGGTNATVPHDVPEGDAPVLAMPAAASPKQGHAQPPTAESAPVQAVPTDAISAETAAATDMPAEAPPQSPSGAASENGWLAAESASGMPGAMPSQPTPGSMPHDAGPAATPESAIPASGAPAKATPKAEKPADRVEIGVLYGFRALFVLFVCNFHIWQQGWLGQYVTVFGRTLDLDFWTRASYVFVDGMMLMSGFLLYLPHARRAVHHTPVPTTGRFYYSRFARIVPSYLFSVLVMLFCVALPLGAYRDDAARNFDILTHLTFTFTFFRETFVFTPLNVVLWTVAIEMQFYLIFPLLVRAMRKAPTVTLCVMGAAGILFRTVLAATVPDLTVLLNQMPSFLDVYALGMLGAIVFVRLDRRLAAAPKRDALRVAVKLAAVALFALAVYALQAILHVQASNGLLGAGQLRLSQWAVRLPLAVTFLALMLAAMFMPRSLQKLLDNRLMRFLAVISFNLYIWHQALSVLVARGLYPATLHSDTQLQQSFTLLCYCLSIVAAMIATYGVEQPAARAMERLYQKHIALKGAKRI